MKLCFRPKDNFIFPLRLDDKVITVMAVAETGFDLAFEGQMFKTLHALEKSKKTTENSPYEVKEFGETFDEATKLSSRDHKDMVQVRTMADRMRVEALEE